VEEPVIKLDRQDAVWIMTMCNGENRFNRQSLDALHGALDTVEACDPPVALVTTGEGKYFSNGYDLEQMATVPDEIAGLAADLHRLLGRLTALPLITVAAVNGHAFGGGAQLAIAHDYVIMRADRGYWCLPEADLGLPLTPEMFAVITAKLPARTAQEAIMTGRRYDGSDAVAAGIAHRAVAEDQVLAEAIALAAPLAAKDRRTLIEHRRLLYGEVMTICGVGQGTGGRIGP
jgi:enoyl-CoA hydratase/carnithine racemase